MNPLPTPALPAQAWTRSPARRMCTLRMATYLAPHLFWFYEFVAGCIGRRLGLGVELSADLTYDDLEHADLAFVCSLPYVECAQLVEPLAAPVLSGERYGDRPIYFSDVVVHADSPICSFAELRGRSWAYNEPRSQSGYGITRD